MMDPASHLGDRYTGCLLGLAAGDALGTTLEFSRPGSFPPLTDMVGGGPFRLAAGEWTDDTSMALCLAESLVECRGFDAVDQLRRYVRWWREGYMSSNGRCFDIGFTTRRALQRFERTGEPWCGSTDDRSAGNGSLMRLAPVALFYARRPAEAVERAADSSRTTHGARDAVDACRYFSSLLVGALAGLPKADLVSARLEPANALWGSQPLSPAVAEVAAGSFLVREPPRITGAGWVVRSLEAALWAFHRSGSFAEGALLAANLGEDADTTASIYGQLAGAYYGAEAIPAAWRARLAHPTLITSLAEALLHHRAPGDRGDGANPR